MQKAHNPEQLLTFLVFFLAGSHYGIFHWTLISHRDKKQFTSFLYYIALFTLLIKVENLNYLIPLK